jgi:hypothetical protein
LDGVVLDGQSATPGPLKDARALKTLLDSGKLVAIANPSAQHLQALRSLTGAGPQEPVALIGFTKVADPAGRAAYRSVIVPVGKPLMIQGVSERGPLAAAPAPHSEPRVCALGPALVSALGARAPGNLGSTGLVPPSGATWGYSTFTCPYSWTIGGPSINGNADDGTAGSYTQTLNGSFTNEFYVYYVDGENPVPPYYYVFMRQTGSFSPLTPGSSGPLANVDNSKGWFQTELQLQSAANNAQGQPFPNGVSPAAHAPVADSPSAGVDVEMILIVNIGEGTGPQTWSAQETPTVSLEGWTVDDLTAGIAPRWRYHQRDMWDPTQYLFSNFGDWWDNVYNNDVVVAPPALSMSALNYETVMAWRFDNSLLTSPRSLWVQFSGSWGTSDGNSPLVAFLHNPAGCRGAEGSTHHHLFSVVGGWGWTWTIDLGQVAQPSS